MLKPTQQQADEFSSIAQAAHFNFENGAYKEAKQAIDELQKMLQTATSEDLIARFEAMPS